MVEKYPLSLRILHWLIAFLVIGLLAAGLTMTELPREDPTRMPIYALHKSVGVAVFALMLLRLSVRLTNAVPPFSPKFARWEARAATFVHQFLYVLLIAMPITGYWMSDAFGFGVKFFGVKLPGIFPVNRDIAEGLEEAHGMLGYLLLGLLTLHVGAVVKHWLVEKENLLKRMW